MSWADIGEPGRDQAGCVRGHCQSNERVARVFEKQGPPSGAIVRLRDTNVTARADDERVLEVLASGLPLHHGAQFAVDITLRSALTAAGLPLTSAAHVNGAALARARCDKERKCGELREGDQCHLVGGLVSTLAVDGVRKRATS